MPQLHDREKTCIFLASIHSLKILKFCLSVCVSVCVHLCKNSDIYYWYEFYSALEALLGN